MDTFQLRSTGAWRLVMMQEVIKSSGNELIMYRHEPRRTVGVIRFDKVFQAGRVRDEGGLHGIVRFR